MARKKFLQDVEATRSNPPAHITGVERLDGDIISFTYWFSQDSTSKQVSLKLITLNVDEYPDHNQYMLFTEEIDVDPIITDSFEQIQAVIDGSSVFTALREVSGALHQALTFGITRNRITRTSSGAASDQSEQDEFDIDDLSGDDDDTSFGLDDIIRSKPLQPTSSKIQKIFSRKHDPSMILDLSTVKAAGFKVGTYGNLSGTGIVCVSVRITKLGISEEAMAAWDLTHDQYLVLLIRFQQGYMSMAEVMELNSLTGLVEMRAGLCTTYKPNQEDALAAFDQTDAIAKAQTTTSASASTQKTKAKCKGKLRPLFIGQPLNDLLRTRFTKIVNFRSQFGLTWGGAERLFNDRQGTLVSDLSEGIATYQEVEDHTSTRALPKIVTEDTLLEFSVKQSSLPLVAIQFLLRHFVRCTDFCLVCHCHLQNTFEALKPYVCSKPLCLYQFLSLGFGPAAEWEILSQPYVVDLLISLCYLQARASRIREFPVGINLRVPVLPSFKNQQAIMTHPYQHPVVASQETLQEPLPAFKGMLCIQQKLLSLVDAATCALSQGDWLVLVSDGDSAGICYCCVTEKNGDDFSLRVHQHSLSTPPYDNSGTGVVDQSSRVSVSCYVYDQNFDDLPSQYQQHAITLLLDTLPSVNEIRNCLLKQQHESRNSNLNALRSQCPRSAIDLLRWIIGSNRSCIMQVDKPGSETNTIHPNKSSEDRVSGMDDWMQFRFAQGAPDKEQRFVDCVRKKSTSLQHPTLFAWHGSPIYNWHSIIRQGLNFDEVLHGRANGHGVYMSPSLSTSLVYTSNRWISSPTGGMSSDWPNSELKVSNVVSLQEVVNAPETFVSRSPHFVVAKKDWIQTRYLFVKTTAGHSKGPASTVHYAQDPRHTARGLQEEPISIPIKAISKSRRPDESTAEGPKTKKRKVEARSLVDLINSDDDDSVATDQEDRDLLNFMVDDDEDFIDDDAFMTDIDDVLGGCASLSQKKTFASNERTRTVEKHASFILDRSKTDFVPGDLDTSGIRFLSPPQYASVTASKALMRAFADTLKLQETTPLHDLGFYIDPDRVENMYQWIIEMHSFDKTLPLARDMEKANLTSIVFEMQFTSNFPFSPPFVRVVKPRFLDPMMGGGGHITSGGAICMELLTSTGWSAANSIESVLLQVRLAICERERPARLLQGRGGFQTSPYGIGEAIEAYKRFCMKHGWKAPEELESLRTM